MRKLSALLFTLLIIASCGQIESKKKNKKSGTKTTSSINSEDYKKSYQFEVNGCNTGEHSFSSSDESEMRRKLCEALQDDELNNGCAESLRFDYFEDNCEGFTWDPA